MSEYSIQIADGEELRSVYVKNIWGKGTNYRDLEQTDNVRVCGHLSER